MGRKTIQVMQLKGGYYNIKGLFENYGPDKYNI